MTLQSNIPKYTRSNPNAICDTCGRKRKWSEVVLSYGSGELAVIVSCKDGCADYRHPLNSPPPVIFDGQPIPDARPEGKDTFIAVLLGEQHQVCTIAFKPDDTEFSFNYYPNHENI
jgi:hypothetical protein